MKNPITHDSLLKALEFAMRVAHAKGCQDTKRGSPGTEDLESFIKTRQQDILKLL